MIRVWHNDRTFSVDRDKPALFPEHFTHVADVATREPGEAFELTNTIHGPWWDNDGLTVTPPVSARGGARSTSVGDVMELPDGRLLLVKGIGFAPVVDNIVDWRDTH
jgi:hypothetical protein